MIVKVALPLVLAFIMFSLGLGLRKQDFSRVLKYPKGFSIGLLNQLILLPLIAFTIASLFTFSPELAVGIMILSLSPGGVTSNVLTRLANGNTPMSISLTAITSLISIITVPLLAAWSVHHFMGVDGPEVNITSLGIKMFLITALPVAAGVALTARVPKLVEKIASPTSKTALALFVIIILAALAKNWTVFSTNLPTLGPAMILLNIIMLAIGLLTCRIAKLNSTEATTISIESGVQNGTLAIAVGSMIALTATETLPPTTVPAAVYSITMYLVSIPFVLYRRRRSTNQYNHHKK